MSVSTRTAKALRRLRTQASARVQALSRAFVRVRGSVHAVRRTWRPAIVTLTVSALLVPASSGLAITCPDVAGALTRTDVALDADGEPIESWVTRELGDATCRQPGEGPQPVHVSILHRDETGAVVEGARTGDRRDLLRTEVRVRDATTRERPVTVTGPLGTEQIERRVGVPMMALVTVSYPSGWQVTGPTGPGIAVRSDRNGVEVSYAALLFPPITASEHALTVDAVPNRGRPTITVRTAPLSALDALDLPDGLLDRDSHAVLAAFAELVADGTDELAEGTEELAEGTRELADGTRELADGTRELADGTRELADGVAEFADGLAELAEGFEEFADGIGELAANMPDIADGAAGIADGVAGLVGILQTLRDGDPDFDPLPLVGLPTVRDDVSAAANDAGTLAADLGALSTAIRSLLDELSIDPDDPDTGDSAVDDAVNDVMGRVAATTSESSDLAAALGALTGQLALAAGYLDGVLASPDIGGFPAGAAELADGLDTIADVLETLAEAADELAEATEEIADAGEELREGTDELADGTDELADGTDELADGTDELADGTDELAEGTEELPDALREIVGIADRAGQRAALNAAVTVAGAQAAAEAEQIPTVLVHAGREPTRPLDVGVPAVLAALLAVIVWQTAQLLRAGITPWRRADQPDATSPTAFPNSTDDG